MLVPAPLLGARAKTRLESRIKTFTRHCICRYRLDLSGCLSGTGKYNGGTGKYNVGTGEEDEKDEKDASCTQTSIDIEAPEGDANGMSYVASGLVPFTEYDVSVTFRNGAGNTTSKTASARTLEALPKARRLPLLSFNDEVLFECDWSNTFVENGVLTAYQVTFQADFGSNSTQLLTKFLNFSSIQARTTQTYVLQDSDPTDAFYRCFVSAQNAIGVSKKAESKGYFLEAANETQILPQAEASNSSMDAGDTGGLVIGLLLLVIIIAAIVFVQYKSRVDAIKAMNGVGANGLTSEETASPSRIP